MDQKHLFVEQFGEKIKILIVILLLIRKTFFNHLQIQRMNHLNILQM